MPCYPSFHYILLVFTGSRLYLILVVSNESMSLIVVEPPLSWLAADWPLLFTKEPGGFFSSFVKSQNLFLLTLLKKAFGL